MYLWGGFKATLYTLVVLYDVRRLTTQKGKYVVLIKESMYDVNQFWYPLSLATRTWDDNFYCSVVGLLTGFESLLMWFRAEMMPTTHSNFFQKWLLDFCGVVKTEFGWWLPTPGQSHQLLPRLERQLTYRYSPRRTDALVIITPHNLMQLDVSSYGVITWRANWPLWRRQYTK